MASRYVPLALLSSLLLLLVSPCSAHTEDTCVEGVYSSIQCSNEGDIGTHRDLQLCTLCNIYLSDANKFFYLSDPSSPSPFKRMEINWRPSVGFSPYRVMIYPMPAEEVAGLAAKVAKSVNNMTTYIVPRLEVSALKGPRG